MSITYRLPNDTHISVNSDLSGCNIYRDNKEIVRIPRYTLLAIVADYVRMQKISILEGQKSEEILGIEDES